MRKAKKNILCPFCHSECGHLGGNVTQKFYCSECYIEITTSKGVIANIHTIAANGSSEEMENWREKILG